MDDNSDTSISPVIYKGKRKVAVLTDSENDSDTSDSHITLTRHNGKRKNHIKESDSDSSIEKPRKVKRMLRVTSESEGSNEESRINRRKKRIVSHSSSDLSESDSETSGASDNGFEDNTSDEWESDWVSASDNEAEITVNEDIKKDPAPSTSMDVGNISDSSDGQAEKCPICLLSFNMQEVGTPETCDHSFCADCIQEWSRNVNTCPVDRQTFTLILVRKHYNGKVIRKIPVDIRRQSVDELIQEDTTYCEVCGMSDREDRLLLCDGCDLGYHLECLDPPLETVPVEEWFCSECRAPSRQNTNHAHIQDNSRRYRSEARLLPRTRQSERVRATIETNRNSALNADQNSLSSGFESVADSAVPGTSRSSSNSATRNRNATIGTRKKKKKKKQRKRTIRTKIVYDICEVTGEKIAIKQKRKSRKRRKRKYKRKNKNGLRRIILPKTVKTRLACQLGMCPPKNVGLAIPEVKLKPNPGNVIGFQRSQAGIPTLHLFGQRDGLDYFSGSDEEVAMPSGNVNILSQARTVISEISALRRTARRKAVFAPEPPTSISSCDILGSILDSQTKLHSKHSVISVSRDGTIHIENIRQKKSEKNNLIKPSNIENILSPPRPVDVTSATEIEVTQAPMFPGRGGGGNRQPYGFHRGGGYRSGDNRYDSGPNYNHFQGGGPRGRGYAPNIYQRDNNFGYMNYPHGGPPPFRGRGGPRYPMRRPQIHPAPPPQRIEPIELVLEDPPEQNQSRDNQSQQPEEDIDIYSDIEATSPVLEEEDTLTPLKSPDIEPTEPSIVPPTFNNSGTDDDSGSELVIDDTVKETDKYDPAEPSADTDSNSEPAVILTETDEAENDLKKLNINVENKVDIIPNENEGQLESLENKPLDTEIVATSTTVSQQTNLPNVSSQVVNEAVQQVLKEHLGTAPARLRDNDDEDDDISDEDCPNFSIYSAESIHIAKSTELSMDIPNDDVKADTATTENDLKERETEIFESVPNVQSAEDKEQENEQPIKENDKKEIEKSESIHDEGDELEDDEDEESNNISNLAENLNDLSTHQNKSEDIDMERPKTEEEPDMIEPQEDSLADLSKPDESESEMVNSVKQPERISQLKESDVIESTTPPLPVAQKSSSPIKIAFDPKRKSNVVPESKKERVLQLYDDSDWEEWDCKVDNDKPDKAEKAQSNDISELDKMTEAISEEERSYTPCLDEKEPGKQQFSDDDHNVGVGLEGLDTEMISDEERNDMFDESHDMKTVSDGDALEINAKESELDLTRPEDYEEGEIVEKMAAKKTQDTQIEKVKDTVIDEDKKKRKKKSEKESDKDKIKENEKQVKKPEFKKLSKSNKERNYRDKEKARSKSKEKKNKDDKENKREKKKEKKKDLERYNVRSLIAEKPKKDQFGRDIDRSLSRSSRSLTPPRRSASRGRRSMSWDKNKKRRRRSRSVRRSRSRSFSRGYTPRSRSRARSLRRSRSFRKSRSPRRSRSRSFRRSRSPRNKKYRTIHRSPSRERYRNRSRRRSIERIKPKKKNRSVSRTRLRSRSPSFTKHRAREWERRHSYSREWTPSWSRSPSPRPVPRHNLPQSMSPSWTPPLVMEKGPVQPENLTVILTNNDMNKTKKRDKKKKSEKKSKEEYRKRKRTERTPPPSKEVFASGDSILVSVSFNKTTEENASANREIIGTKRKRDSITDSNKKSKKEKGTKEKKKRAKSPRTKKKIKEIAELKPVAIIDLDRSPFKELTPSPKDIIILSDSDNCEKEDDAINHHDMLQEELMTMESQNQEDSAPQSPTSNYLNSTGPKTPPEPQIKFLLTTKQTQLRAINNPLHDPNDEVEGEIDPQEELEQRLNDVLHKGPNTPPEPPSSPPSSPDAYDPFDPTKSRSPTPEPQTTSQPNSTVLNTPGDKIEEDGDLVDLAVGPLESSQKSTSSLDNAEKRSSSLDRPSKISLSPDRTSQTLTPPVSTTDLQTLESDASKGDTEKSVKSPERNSIGVVINQQVQPQQSLFPAVVKPIIPTAVYSSVTPSVITSTPVLSNAPVPRTNLFNTSTTTPRMVPASVPQRIILPTPAKSSPAKMSPLKSSPSKPPIKSTPIKPMPSKTMISKLPVPNVKPLTPIRKGVQPKQGSRTLGQNGNEVIDVDLDFESPYSPGSSDYEDLFEPPAETTKNNSNTRPQQTKTTSKSPAKQNAFDTLFGSSPVYRAPNNKNKGKTNTAKIPVKMNKKTSPVKAAGNKTHVGVKVDEDHLKILDDLPNSAVEMQVKDKFLKKLNRQERVVEEVKLVLKPHYNKKHITKEQYKDILRRAVPKICHNKSGEINPKKIQNLIEAYVKKARYSKKTSGNPSGAAPQVKSAKTTLWS